MSTNYQVIIVGAGPAGIFAALALAEAGREGVLLLDQGPDLAERVGEQPVGARASEGFGGAGAFADGKLTVTTAVGGRLAEVVGDARAEQLVAEVDDLWVRYGAPRELFGEDTETTADLARRATLAGMKLLRVPLRHYGTDQSPLLLGAMREDLLGRVELRTRCRVSDLVVEDGAVRGVVLADGAKLTAPAVIVCPGRSGSGWFQEVGRRLGLPQENNAVDVGVRVEVPAAVMAELTDALYEFKLLYWSRMFDNLVRTFCVCPYGEVVAERLDGIVLVNGHSYSQRRTENTNFALLVSSRFTAPFHEPIQYGKYIAGLANLLGEGVLVQRLGDLRRGRRTTDHRLSHSILRPTLTSATPGDLSFVLPYRHLSVILEMLEALDRLAPGVADGHTLLYGAEVKLYSSRVATDASLQTPIRGLYVCGDGAGLTRGLVQASASGRLAGQSVARSLPA
jgi:hypothetical protein